jgi:deoxycytidylate deaminase
MSTHSGVPLRSVPATKPTSSQVELKRVLDGLQSHEIVIGFSGPLGSGVEDVVSVLVAILEQLDYTVVQLKLSALIKKYSAKSAEVSTNLGALKGEEYYERLQSLGNSLREDKGLDFLSQLAIREISLDRAQRHAGIDIKNIVPRRIAYLVDQLKHPAEVALLRAVYEDNFFLISVLCGYEQRKRNLKNHEIDQVAAERLMERDRKEDERSGQQLEKTLQLADFFVRNSKSNTAQLREPLERFLHLVHGAINITPTRHEQGMYAAYSAALGSACLSRQVGAAIIDDNGKLIATGCNDVPRGGGGLYREGDKKNDHRCINIQGGICSNHKKKDELKAQIRKTVKNAVSTKLEKHIEDLATRALIAEDLAEQIASEVRQESRLRDLIEFSRSVHAEMDALVSLSRSGNGRSQDGVLYTTTYPCHNCARHIVAAGIRSVYFVEPYEKSLANELHHDAIEHDADEDQLPSEWADADRVKQRRVRFLHFEGVAPRRFLDLFSGGGERKDDATGKAKVWGGRTATKKVPEYLEGYMELESRVVRHLEELGVGVQPIR